MIIEPSLPDEINVDAQPATEGLFQSLQQDGFVILHDVYKDPLSIRRHLLEQEFVRLHPEYGYFAARTVSGFDMRLLEAVAYFLNITLYDILTRECTTVNRTVIGLQNTNEINCIHSDPFMYAGILYLSPEPPENSGTLFFENESDGKRRRNHFREFRDLKYDMPLNVVDKSEEASYRIWKRIENRFNTLAIYDARLFHASAGFFGNELAEGRLTQNIFFNVNQSYRN